MSSAHRSSEVGAGPVSQAAPRALEMKLWCDPETTAVGCNNDRYADINL